MVLPRAGRRTEGADDRARRTRKAARSRLTRIVNPHPPPASAAAAATGGTFGLLRRWIGSVFRQTPTSTLLARARPYLPQILAYLTIILGTCVLVSTVVGVLGHDWMRWYGATAVAAVLVVGTLHLDPAEYSLHAFYRERICRAYISASNGAARGRAGPWKRRRKARTAEAATSAVRLSVLFILEAYPEEEGGGGPESRAASAADVRS